MATTSFVLLALVALLGNVHCQFDGRIARECVGKAMDIFFILDSSTSIYINDYRLQHTFVRDVVSQFDISNEATRVGFVTFSDDIERPALDFSRFQEKNEVLNSINERNLPYRTGVTNTDLAISYVRREPRFREDVTKVIVIITDGGARSPSAARREARLAKENGFYVFVVGIGTYLEENEWNDMATEPYVNFVYNITNFRFLDTVKTSLPSRACPLPPLVTREYCRIENGASVSFVSGPQTSGDALYLINHLMENSDDRGSRANFNYFLEACDNAVEQGHGDIYRYCNRFFSPDGNTAYTYQSQSNDAFDAALRQAIQNKVVILFVDGTAANRYDLENQVRRFQRAGVKVIVVDMTSFREAQFVTQNVLNDPNNYIAFTEPASVVTQVQAQTNLIDATCRAINGRRLPFVPV